MMTGHEVGAALGVAVLTAVAGDLTTRAGLVAGHPEAFVAVAVLLLALLVPAAFVPKTAGSGGGRARPHALTSGSDRRRDAQPSRRVSAASAGRARRGRSPRSWRRRCAGGSRRCGG